MLYDSVKDFIDEKTNHLLSWLLFCTPEVKIQCYQNHVLEDGSDTISKTIRRVRLAKSDDSHLNSMVKDADDNWKKNADKLVKQFKVSIPRQ